MSDFSAQLPGETQYLRKLVDNPASATARFEYLTWLQRHGAEYRADFISQLNIAFESMTASDLPDVDSAPAAWARVTGATSLADLLEDGEYNPVTYMDHSELSNAVEKLFQHSRPALNIDFEPSDDVSGVGQSRLWGEPDLPDDMAWPTLGSCLQPWAIDMDPESPCSFLGQLNFSELRASVISYDLPVTGLLSIFCHVDGYNGGLSVNLIYVADPSSTSRRSAPSNLDEFNQGAPPHAINFSDALAFPEYDGPWEKDLLVRDEDEGIDEGAYYAITEGGGASLVGLLGYFTSTTGGDPTPDKSIRKLACMRVTPDWGVVHLGIAEPDLQTGNLTAFTYPWYDWDL